MKELICARCGLITILRPQGLLCILRHGRSGMNNKRLIIGSIDDPLDEEGYAQAEGVISSLRLEKFDRVKSSPLARARQTAKVICAALNLEAEIDHRLRERCVGEYEGREEFPGMLKKFLGEKLPAPGAEPLSVFTDRVLATLREFCHAPQHSVLIVTHALPLLILVKEIKGLSLKKIFRYQAPANCVPVKFYFGNSCKCGSNFYAEKSN